MIGQEHIWTYSLNMEFTTALNVLQTTRPRRFESFLTTYSPVATKVGAAPSTEGTNAVGGNAGTFTIGFSRGCTSEA